MVPLLFGPTELRRAGFHGCPTDSPDWMSWAPEIIRNQVLAWRFSARPLCRGGPRETLLGSRAWGAGRRVPRTQLIGPLPHKHDGAVDVSLFCDHRVPHAGRNHERSAQQAGCVARREVFDDRLGVLRERCGHHRPRGEQGPGLQVRRFACVLCMEQEPSGGVRHRRTRGCRAQSSIFKYSYPPPCRSSIENPSSSLPGARYTASASTLAKLSMGMVAISRPNVSRVQYSDSGTSQRCTSVASLLLSPSTRKMSVTMM